MAKVDKELPSRSKEGQGLRDEDGLGAGVSPRTTVEPPPQIGQAQLNFPR